MLVVFLGPPGGGKGTQAARLSTKYGLPKVSTGEMLREAVAAGTPLGAVVRGIMEAGELVDDETMAKVVDQRLRQAEASEGVIMDGYPRTRGQAETLDELVRETGLGQVDLVLLLSVPEADLVARLSGRRACPQCGANYHVSFKPPRTEGVCDRCGSSLQQREDDREEAIRERFSVYHRTTEPVADYYRVRGVLREINGSGTIDDVFARVDDAMAGAVRS